MTMTNKKKGAIASEETTAQNEMVTNSNTEMVEQSTPLIVVEQIPIITERLRSVKDEVSKKAEQAMSLVCTEDNYKIIKQIRAALNKEFAALEEQRKLVKKQVMDPYKTFEDAYKECVADAYKAADADLKAKINEVEDSIKAKKRETLEQMFLEYCEERGIPEQFRWLGDVKIGLSDSEVSLNFTAQERALQIWNDLRTISYQEYRDEILYEYATGASCSQAIATVVERHKTLEEQAKAEEAANENPWDDIIGTTAITIRVRATDKRLKMLKDWMTENEFNWKEI